MDAFPGLDGIDVARAVLRDVLRGLDLERADHRRALTHVIAAVEELNAIAPSGRASEPFR